MRIRDLAIDPHVIQLLEEEGLDQLYPPQEDAVKAGILDGKNLVLASPTASGKTLVAELCILKHVLEHQGKAIYLAPLRALASEKYREFQRYSSIKKPNGERLRIGISTGDFDSTDPWLGRNDVIISTNEKCLDCSEEVLVVQGEEVRILKIAELFDEVAKKGSILPGPGIENAVPEAPLCSLSLNLDSWGVEISEINCVSKISQNTDPLHRLKFESGRTLAVTSDHKIFVLQDGLIEKVKASEAVGRTGVCLRDLSRVFHSQLRSIDLLQEFEKSGHLRSFKGVFTERDFSKLALALRKRGLSVRRANERVRYYARRGVAPMTLLVEAGMQETVTGILSTRAPEDRNMVQRSLPLSRELGKLVGYLVSEGSFSLTPRSANTRIATISEEILDDLKFCAKSLGLEFRIYRKTNHPQYEFRISSKVVFHLFRDVLGLGTGAAKKLLPSFFMHANEEFQKGLLSSLFDGDGGISPTGIEYCTKNRSLALQLTLLLAKYDVHTKIVPYRPRRYRQNVYWRVAVMGAQNIRRLGNIISPVRPAIRHGLDRLSLSPHGREDQAGNVPARDLPSMSPANSSVYYRLAHARNQGTRVSRHAVSQFARDSGNAKLEKIASAPLAYLRVKENSTAPPPSAVYNLQTSRGNFFTASGVLVSNCDSLLRHKAPWMSELSLVVADEVHLLTEHERGPTLEVVLTRLNEINPKMQVLALSATVSNAQEVGEWLHAGSVTTEWRPVPLREGIYHEGQVQFSDGTSRIIEGLTNSPVLDIALDVVASGGQALVFTETRRSAVEMGRRAALALKGRLSRPEERSLALLSERVLSSGEKTRLSEALAGQVLTGAAFHHAGLTGVHRETVEDSFRNGKIKILAATPTLCLPAGEEVFGNPAPIAIEKLSGSDRVLTHRNTFRNVVAPTSREYEGPLVKVTPWFQLPMRMTPEHNVLRVTRTRRSLHNRRTNRHWWSYSRPEWTEARNLKVGDLVLFPRIKEECDLRSLDLPMQGPLSNDNGIVGEHWSRLKVSRIELRPETLEVLGLYIAEGYTGKNGQVMFALNTKETLLTLQIGAWFNAIGLRYRVIDSDRHRRVIRACSKQLAQLLRDLCGREAAEKRIPHQLMALPIIRLRHLVRGMWRGDGDVTRVGARTARYSTVSRCLARQLFALLVKIGYMPGIYMTKRAGKDSGRGLRITRRHDLYTVSISGKQLTSFLEDVLGVSSGKFDGSREFNRGHIDSNYYYMPVRKIEREAYRGTVHNLEVEGHNSYVGSFVVHNSAGVNLPARTVVISSYERYEAGFGRYPITVLEYKQFCLPHDTPVTLEDGSPAPIGRLVRGKVRAKVLTLSNPHGIVSRSITEHFERVADELIDVSTNIGRKLTATPEHPVLTKARDGRPVWTPIKALKMGDYLAYAREITTPDDPVYSLDFLPPDKTWVMQPIEWFRKKRIRWKYEEVARRLGVTVKTFKTYTSRRRNPPLRIVLALADMLGLEKDAVASEIRLVKSRWGKPVRITPTIDGHFMWLAGIIASDGHLKKSANKRGTYYQIRVFNKDERIIRRTVSILEGMGLSPQVTSRGDSQLTVSVGSTLLGSMISRFGIPTARKSVDIVVPEFMLHFPRGLIGAFLAGVFDGDGSHSDVKFPRGINTRVRAIVIATGSEKFAWGIHDLLLRLGIVSTVVKNARVLTVTLNCKLTTFPNPVYTVIFRRVSDIQRFRSYARSVKLIPEVDYTEYRHVGEYWQAQSSRSYAWVKVCTVERRKLSKPVRVYNVSVHDTETYLASNFIVHNCGRAGRPKYDKFGESLLIARNADEAEWLMENYVLAKPEKLWSKLAVEKVLRPHVLSTIAAGYARTEEGLYEFFSRTLYAHQYGPRLIKGKIGDILRFLCDEEMVLMEGKELVATKFGKRVSELYIDPESAVILRDGLYNRAKKLSDFSLLHLIAKTPDLAPRPRPRGKETESLGLLAIQHSGEFTFDVPEEFEDPMAYEEFLSELKAAQVLDDWIGEHTEDEILEARKVEPGDLLRLVQGSEWLVFAAQELARLFGHKDLLPSLGVLRVRVSKGVKPELLKLVGLEGIGRVRARMLFASGLKTIEDIKERSLTELTSIPTIGPALAKRIKEKAGGLIKADEWERAKNAKGSGVEQQVTLTDYEDTE